VPRPYGVRCPPDPDLALGPQDMPQVRADALSRVVTVPPVPRAVSAARDWSRQTVSRWRLGEVADPVGQLVSELVTNSIEHAECVSVTVLLMYAAGMLRLEVRDQDGAHVPVLRYPAPGDLNGRGLVIVEALSDRWGVRVTDAGKAVWCELAAGPSTAPASRDGHEGKAGHGD
jgi:anti-sigma regulatory factor (Ser/Thr protein kinase)